MNESLMHALPSLRPVPMRGRIMDKVINENDVINEIITTRYLSDALLTTTLLFAVNELTEPPIPVVVVLAVV